MSAIVQFVFIESTRYLQGGESGARESFFAADISRYMRDNLGPEQRERRLE
jgi:hypothetical protein